jgi:hypothetical protein
MWWSLYAWATRPTTVRLTYLISLLHLLHVLSLLLTPSMLLLIIISIMVLLLILLTWRVLCGCPCGVRDLRV